MVFMVTFSIFQAPARGSLKRRRAFSYARRLAAALCAGLAVLFGLQALLATIETSPVVVAVNPIRRGAAITAEDVQVVAMPVGALGPSMVEETADVVGGIAQIDIAAGDAITVHMARNAPLAPTGTTVIAVRLASSPDELLPGDEVSLVSAVGCDGDDCMLAEDALVMGVKGRGTSSDDSDGGGSGSLGSVYGDDAKTVSCAMKPEDAARVMELQEAGAVIAVMR